MVSLLSCGCCSTLDQSYKTHGILYFHSADREFPKGTQLMVVLRSIVDFIKY